LVAPTCRYKPKKQGFRDPIALEIEIKEIQTNVKVQKSICNRTVESSCVWKLTRVEALIFTNYKTAFMLPVPYPQAQEIAPKKIYLGIQTRH
jgi:hypothetical protein